ncbi:hypothetical protein PSH54_19175 [Pseudoalteromonas sp. Angola-30]|uniref:hypothetical protein n=1 Tax=Pseudoalteromonas sp. Angola-30 TaxID=3025341 RepID=UPI002358EC67|nr:hypothetical protein [Pseudoalteromonas sp. Angola-30]MDC9527603.1 hypothetical protein [Pseudoalteromonas sp. Angola-30]
MSGLISPILEQAGFVKSKLALAIEWVAELDGFSQQWNLSSPVTIPFGSDFKVSGAGIFSRDGFYFAASKDSDRGRFMISGSTGNVYFNASNIGNLSSEKLQSLADGNPHKVTFQRVNGVDASLLVDGEVYMSNSWSDQEVYLDSIGAQWGNNTSIPSFEGALYNFEIEIDGVLTNSIPLTNKEQGATQLPTVGNVSAFMPNYTDAVWKNKAKL